MSAGGRARCFVIAEAGVNHGGDLELGQRLVDAAAESGADAVKFQSFCAQEIVDASAPSAEYQRRAGQGASQRSMLSSLELSGEAHAALRSRAEQRGIEFLSTPYDPESADLLERLGVTRFKIASGEITNLRLIRHVARKGRPIVLSTGMSTLEEVGAAVSVIQATEAPLTLLHCTSSYPTHPGECNLTAMETMRRAFRVPVGYSDHTEGVAIACAAVALGAVMLEKHLTLDRSLDGPDHAVSLEPAAFSELVESIRDVERSLGDGVKRPVASESEARVLARRGLVAARSLPAGRRIVRGDVSAVRPARGLPASALDSVVGRQLRRALSAGESISGADLLA